MKSKCALEEGGRWYDYKFLIVGAFLAAFLGQFVFHKGTTEKRLEELLVPKAYFGRIYY